MAVVRVDISKDEKGNWIAENKNRRNSKTVFDKKDSIYSLKLTHWNLEIKEGLAKVNYHKQLKDRVKETETTFPLEEGSLFLPGSYSKFDFRKKEIQNELDKFNILYLKRVDMKTFKGVIKDVNIRENNNFNQLIEQTENLNQLFKIYDSEVYSDNAKIIKVNHYYCELHGRRNELNLTENSLKKIVEILKKTKKLYIGRLTCEVLFDFKNFIILPYFSKSILCYNNKLTLEDIVQSEEWKSVKMIKYDNSILI